MITDNGFEQGGISTYLLAIKKLLEKKNTVKLLTSNQNSSRARFSDYEFKGFNNTPLLIQLIYRIYNPFSAIELNRVLKSYKPDIVHLHFIFGNTSPSILPCLKSIPTIMSVHCQSLIRPIDLIYNPLICKHGTDDYCRKCIGTFKYYYNRIKYLLYRINMSNIDLFLSNSQFLAKSLHNACVSPTRTIQLGIKLLNYSKITEWNKLVYVGRMEKQKGIEFLLIAMPNIINNIPDVHLELVGDGFEMKYLKQLVKELRIEKNVTFVGWIPNNRIKNYYKKSTIALVPSLWSESFGLVGLEAMSAGRPVIASRVGGIPEWLEDGKTGFLVEPRNPKQLAEKIIYLLSNRKLLQEMGKNARKRAEQFSIEKHVNEIEKIYLDVINKYKLKKITKK